MELSRQKAEETAAAQTEDCIIIGADTVVARGEKIMGKPKDAADAKQMLRSIADDCHQVYTGVTLIRTGAHPQSVTFQEKTNVCLYPISDAELDAYIASGDPMDKAGAYGIQGDFAIYVKRIVGDYYNVVGLPIGRVYQELKRMLFVKKMNGFSLFLWKMKDLAVLLLTDNKNSLFNNKNLCIYLVDTQNIF